MKLKNDKKLFFFLKIDVFLKKPINNAKIKK